MLETTLELGLKWTFRDDAHARLFNGDDNLFGGENNDFLYGGRGADELDGGDGEDIINGMGGKDQLRGGDDNDTINGWTGNDTMFGDAGSDIFQFDNGSGADFAADFVDGIDSIEVDGALAGGVLTGLTGQQIVDTYGNQVSTKRIDLNFGNGDVLKILSDDGAFTLADLYDDVSVI